MIAIVAGIASLEVVLVDGIHRLVEGAEPVAVAGIQREPWLVAAQTALAQLAEEELRQRMTSKRRETAYQQMIVVGAC
jgi:hypothetical protein